MEGGEKGKKEGCCEGFNRNSRKVLVEINHSWSSRGRNFTTPVHDLLPHNLVQNQAHWREGAGLPSVVRTEYKNLMAEAHD